MRSVLLLILLLAAGPALGNSITIVDGATFTFFDPYSDPHPTNGITEVTGTFVPFDTSLGTLTSVTFRIGGTYGAGLRFTATDPGIYVGSLRPVETFGVVGGPELWSEPFRCCLGSGAGAWLVEDGGAVTQYFTGQPPCCGEFAPYEMYFTDGNGGLARPITITDNLDPFLNPGSVFVGTRHDVFDIGFPDGSRNDIYATDSDGYFSVAPYGDVTYTYTPVPEPGTALLVGLGLAMVATRRSRSARCGEQQQSDCCRSCRDWLHRG